MGRVHVYDASYETIDETIEQVFADFSLELRGKRVLVKPNILGPFPPERHITTHPSVVRALVTKLTRQQAEVTVGDNPGMRGYGTNLRCAEASGILEAAGGHYRNISASPKTVRTNSRFAGEFVVSRAIFEADYLMTLPKFKTHLLTTITGAVKNSYGFLVGGQKGILHQLTGNPTSFAEVVVDVYQLRPPDFVIMDAVVAMQGVGPSCKDLRPDVGKILAGDNSVELDAVMAAMMGLEPADVPMLRIAHERGLGEINPARIELNRPIQPIPDFKLPESRTGGVFESFITRLATRIMVKRPVANPRICTRCGVCARQCPASAITMTPYPHVDRRKCTSCFCCIEFCQEDAMDVTRLIKFFRSHF